MKKALYFLTGSVFTGALLAGVWAYADGATASTDTTNKFAIAPVQNTSQTETFSFDQVQKLDFTWKCAENEWTVSYHRNGQQLEASVDSILNGTKTHLIGTKAVDTIKQIFDRLPVNPDQAQNRLNNQLSPNLYVLTGDMELTIQLSDGKQYRYHYIDGKTAPLADHTQQTGQNPQQTVQKSLPAVQTNATIKSEKKKHGKPDKDNPDNGKPEKHHLKHKNQAGNEDMHDYGDDHDNDHGVDD